MLLLRNEDLLKNRIGLEKTLAKQIVEDTLHEDLDAERVSKPRGTGKRRREKQTEKLNNETAETMGDKSDQDNEITVQQEDSNEIPVLINCQTDANKTKPFQSQNAGEKEYVYVVGDATVRGLGPMIQDQQCEGQVAVRAGSTMEEAARQIGKDINHIQQGAIVISCGSNNLHQKPEDARRAAEDLIEIITWENVNRKVTVGILEVPIQKDHKRNICALAVNDALRNRCAGTDIRIINCQLKHDDLGKDGEQLNMKGRVKVAKSIRRFVTGTLQV